MQLASNHLFLTAGNDIAEIARPLQQLGVTYFSYMKSDASGGRIYLYNNVAILDSYLKNEYYLRGNKESAPVNYKQQICLWSTLSNQQEYDENVRARGIDHGMFIFEPNGTSLEAFAFATQKENERIINTYLTKLDFFKQFTYYFKEKAQSIIASAEKHKIILPFHNKKPDLFDDDTVSPFAISPLSNILSKRQMECCSLLLKGKTSKEIAASLGLSFRTVEFYISNIKIKLNCKNKSDLIRKLSISLL